MSYKNDTAFEGANSTTDHDNILLIGKLASNHVVCEPRPNSPIVKALTVLCLAFLVELAVLIFPYAPGFYYAATLYVLGKSEHCKREN